jgi:hypothetical protein
MAKSLSSEEERQLSHLSKVAENTQQSLFELTRTRNQVCTRLSLEYRGLTFFSS